MQAGNTHYCRRDDLPANAPVFPLRGALLLPGGQLPLNIFEQRYLAMFDDALAGDRIVGVIQPEIAEGRKGSSCDVPKLCPVGCLGRITSFSETGDGRYIASLTGICRFKPVEETASNKAYRTCRLTPFVEDLMPDETADSVDRDKLVASFKAYLDANDLEADWSSVAKASITTLVNSMAMMSPFGPAEKQALLEAPDLKARTQTLIAITEIAVAHGGCERHHPTVQ